MARATYRARADRGGAIYVHYEGVVDGERVRAKRRIDGGEEQARRICEEVNTRFAVGDLELLRHALADQKAKRVPQRSRRVRTPTLRAWSERWLKELHGTVATSTYNTSRYVLEVALRDVPADRALGNLEIGDLIAMRTKLQREGIADATIAARVKTLRRVVSSAVLAGILDANPYATRLPSQRTKRRRRADRASKVPTLPLTLAELERLLEVLRSPRPDRPREVAGFPLTEALLLTGLRFGEVAALVWPVVDWRGGRVAIVRAIERGVPPSLDTPTKTGAEWTIPLRAPLRALLQRQREAIYLRDPDGWVFTTARGGHWTNPHWHQHIWPEVLRRSKITSDATGNAQKLLRKAYATNAIICGRNPKRISAEFGHSSLAMLMRHYELWFDESTWPDPRSVAQLRQLYGFDDEAGGAASGSA